MKIMDFGPRQQRRFVMLQGPHGPFFRQLGGLLRQAGCDVVRIGFNRGDAFFWGRDGYLPFTSPLSDWPIYFKNLCDELNLTDLVLYGDSRPIHKTAIKIALDRGIRVHVFEEGYIRPYWATYERGGSNGHSRLMSLGLEEMGEALRRFEMDLPQAPTHWGDMREHIFYGAIYHFLVMTGNRRYRSFEPHRGISVREEFRLYLRRLIFMPMHSIGRWLTTLRIRRGRFPYHLVLLQLEHDASFRAHSDFASMTDFISLCLTEFARGAPPHHHLVFKAHPLEDDRAAVAATIRDEARRLGLAARVHFLRGGKLAQVLDGARSAVTVNSTAGQQVLWRGLPLKAFGRAVYAKPEFVSDQPLADFFAEPQRPDARAYRIYRHYLMETSQIPGGFYSSVGRRRLLRQVVDMILAPSDPYEALSSGTAAPRQHLAVID